MIKTTDHPYYCSLSNYYASGSNHGGIDYDSWADFKEEWFDEDMDFSFLFRFDILDHTDEDDEPDDTKTLYLFYMLQRKGNFTPVVVHNIKEEDMEEIESFLAKYWEYMKLMWSEFSGLDKGAV